MSKKNDMFWHICDNYEYSAFKQGDEGSFVEMTEEFKKLNKNDINETIADLELAKCNRLSARELKLVNIIFNN